MVYLSVLLGIIVMAIMIYLAVDKKSNLAIRLASLIALGIMILTVIICLFIVLTDNRVPVDESVLIVGAPVETSDDRGNNLLALFFLIIFLLGIFVLIAYLALKENRRQTLKHPVIKLRFLINLNFNSDQGKLRFTYGLLQGRINPGGVL